MRQRLLRRRLLLWRLGDPRAPLAAAAPGTARTTARPSTFRHGLSRGRGGAGLTQTEATPSDSQACPRDGGGGSARLLRPPGGARAASESARTRGPLLRAVLALARRRLLRPARPRHWVGVSERGRGAAVPPSWAPRGGARPELGPAAFGKGLQSARSHVAAFKALVCSLSAPPPPLPLGRSYPASGSPGFPGRGPKPERAARERAQPLGSAEHVTEANARRVTLCVGMGWPAVATPFCGLQDTSPTPAKGAVNGDPATGHHLGHLS